MLSDDAFIPATLDRPVPRRCLDRTILLLDVLIGKQVRGPAFVHHLPLVDDVGAVRDAQRDFDVLLDKKDRRACRLSGAGQSRLPHGCSILSVSDPERFTARRTSYVMTDHSQFDRTPRRANRPGNGRFVVAVILGLILGAGLMALWGIYGSVPPEPPEADVAANASNETAQAVKDLQTTEQKIVGQLQSLQQAIASNQAETKQTLAAEQAETKRLSDQVAALSGKLDALQQSFAGVQQQASPAPSEPSPAPAKRRR